MNAAALNGKKIVGKCGKNDKLFLVLLSSWKKTGQKETERGKKRQASDREEKTTKEKIFFGKKTKKFIENKIGMRSRHWDIRKDPPAFKNHVSV